jgi:hypothetical protein
VVHERHARRPVHRDGANAGRCRERKAAEADHAFIVEASWPGVEVVHRCRFMGLKAIENGVIRFTNVKIPRENVLWETGKGSRSRSSRSTPASHVAGERRRGKQGAACSRRARGRRKECNGERL